jgi:hypothetical protein
MRFEEAFIIWQDGERRLSAADPGDRPALERVVDELVVELRRRLGGSFTTDELARLYAGESADWAFAVATQVAPVNPAAWDMPTVVGAAYARYAREASDYRLKQAVLDDR